MLLLLGMGFFMGIFLATYQVGAETLFLDVLGDEYLDYAFFAAGGAGILVTLVFVFLQRKINYSTLIVSNLFMIFVFMALMRGAFEWTDYDGTVEGFSLLPFLMFVMMGPITAITILGFWGVFGRMFDLRASKRIIGGIDTGALTSTIIAFFSIPYITKLPFINATYDLLFVSALASFGVLIFTIWIAREFNLDKATKQSSFGENVKPKKVKFVDLVTDPYLRILSLFLIFSMGASVFMDYTFYSATDIMYPEEEKLTTFLSFFHGTVIIMSFLIQSFINDIIIGRFGLKVALMTMPIVLILFTIGGIISGHIFGYELKTKEFILFFIFMACGKAFTASLKDALESPAFKLLFLPIDVKIRFDIQTRIEGVVNEVATLVAGGMQIALGLLVWFKLIHYSYFVLGIAGMVVYLAAKLFSQYKSTLKTTLAKQKEGLKGEGRRNENSTLNILRREISSKDPDHVINGLKLFEKLEPIQFERVLLDLLNSRHGKVRQYAYEKLEQVLAFDAIEIIKKDFKTEGDESVVEVAERCIDRLQAIADYDLNDVSIRKLVRSTDAKNRIKGAMVLSKSQDDKHLPYILELLRDINPEVRRTAMIAAGKMKRPEIWPVLIENLHLATYSNTAMSALAHAGENAFHNIDTSFYKTGQYRHTMLRIVQLLGRVGGRTATDLLWKKVDYPDKQIVSQILLALSYIGFQARDFQAARIKLAIDSEIGDIAWNIKALMDVPDDDDPVNQLIREAFTEEDRLNYSNIFMLLSMIYDPQSVVLVKDNIEDGTVESITFATEMLDIFVDEELKPKILPIMDDLKVFERLNKLNDHYPPEDFESYYDLLLQIINRDYNRINRYTKALAMHKLATMDVEVSADLIANLFNPDPLLLQTAANTIYQLDKQAYQLHTKRLKPGVKKELDKSIVPPVYKDDNEEYHQKLLLIERVLLLKQIPEFQKISGELITYLAEELDEVRMVSGTQVVEAGDGGDVPMYIVVEGNLDVYVGDELRLQKSRGDLVGHEYVLPSSKFEYTALTRGDCTLLVLRKEELLDLMSKHLDILEAYLDILNREEFAEEEEVILSDIF